MTLKNKIVSGLCMAAAMVSFLHPFSGEMAYAESAKAVIEEAETKAEEREAEAEESTVKEENEAEAEKSAAKEAKEAEAKESAAKEAEEAEAKESAEKETKEAEAKESAAKEAEEAEAKESAEKETKEAEAKENATKEAKEAETEEKETETAGEKEVMAEKNIAEEAEKTMEEEAIEEEAVAWPLMLMSLSSGESSMGISDTAPQRGQENRYQPDGQNVTWIVPASGYYDLYCYGAQGGSGGYDYGVSDREDSYASGGSKGAVRGARAFLEKGTELVICAGQMPGKGSCSYGEGATNGKKYQNSYGNEINGFATYWYRRTYWGSRTFGEAHRYRGYPDGGYGEEERTICDSNKNHSGGAVGGGGGGSSYILMGETKILSARGGNGGNSHYKCPDGSGTAGGGAGGGVTVLEEAEGVSWCREELDETQSAGNEGQGYVLIRVVTVAPIAELRPSERDWTKEAITITAAIKSEGQGLLHPCFSWESDEEGNPVWTDEASYTVSQNGTYRCKIRDEEGNIGEAILEIGNIDRLLPTGEITADTMEWTKEDVILSITAEDAAETAEYGKAGLAEGDFLWGYENEEGEMVWEEAVTADEGYTADKNGKYQCRIRDLAGNEAVCEYNVTNIDRTPPEIAYEHTKDWYGGSARLTWMGRDLQPDGSEGSGLHETAYSLDGICFQEISEMQIGQEGTYTLWVRDKLGNQKMYEMEMHYDEKPRDKSKGDKKTEEIAEKKEEILPLPIDMLPIDLSLIDGTEQTGQSGADRQWEKEMTKREEDTIKKDTQELLTPVFTIQEKMSEQSPGMEKEEKLSERELQSLWEETEEKPERRLKWKRLILYSVWMVTVLCGLLFVLFCLLFEHVEVYQREKGGKYCKIGRCAMFRKREYVQINLIHLMKKQGKRDYLLRFSGVYVCLHKKEKVLVRTTEGVELRNVARKIEILCNE